MSSAEVIHQVQCLNCGRRGSVTYPAYGADDYNSLDQTRGIWRGFKLIFDQVLQLYRMACESCGSFSKKRWIDGLR